MTTFWIIAAAVFACDWLTKHVVRASMPVGSEIPVLPFFSLAHVKNTGIAFGLFQQRNYLFLGLGLVVSVALVIFGRRLVAEDRVSGLAMAGVLGGAAGNLLDRFLFGQVTDFFDFYLGSHHWPVFNIADSAICVGAALLLFRNVSNKTETRG